MIWFVASLLILALFFCEYFRSKAEEFEKEAGYWRNEAMRQLNYRICREELNQIIHRGDRINFEDNSDN